MGKIIHMMHQRNVPNLKKKGDVWCETGSILILNFKSHASFKVNVDAHTGIQKPVLEVSTAISVAACKKVNINICDGLISLSALPFFILARAVEVSGQNKIERVMFSFYERKTSKTLRI